jgi:formylglycine-generating enzyme required for sulfatase activity
MRRKNRTKLLSVIMISGVVFFLFIIAGTFIYAQNPVTNTVQVGPAKAKKAQPKIGEEVHPLGTKGGPMVYIPAGEFMMGCAVDNDCFDEEKPYHRVYLDAYYIDKFEVTVDDYEDCVRAGKCSDYHLTGDEYPDRKFIENEDCNWGKLKKGNHPINCVDWRQSKTYCKWAGKQLPTEAEWEKAARGTEGRIYPYGNQFINCEKSCNSISQCKHHSTCPVGSYADDKSPYGVMDMAGNVWEWVQDWYDWGYYAKSPSKNPQGPFSGKERAVRGGSWGVNGEGDTGTSPRNQGDPRDKFVVLGFRCARDAN